MCSLLPLSFPKQKLEAGLGISLDSHPLFELPAPNPLVVGQEVNSKPWQIARAVLIQSVQGLTFESLVPGDRAIQH